MPSETADGSGFRLGTNAWRIEPDTVNESVHRGGDTCSVEDRRGGYLKFPRYAAG